MACLCFPIVWGLSCEALGKRGFEDHESPGDLDKMQNTHIMTQKVQTGEWVRGGLRHVSASDPRTIPSGARKIFGFLIHE